MLHFSLLCRRSRVHAWRSQSWEGPIPDTLGGICPTQHPVDCARLNQSSDLAENSFVCWGGPELDMFFKGGVVVEAHLLN